MYIIAHVEQLSETQNYKVKDINLAKKGRMRIDWAESRMPVLMKLCLLYTSPSPRDRG